MGLETLAAIGITGSLASGISTVGTIASVAGAVSSIAGAVGGAGKKAPQVQSAAQQDLTAAANTTAQRNSLLLETQGGSAGEILQTGQVSNRNTLLGN